MLHTQPDVAIPLNLIKLDIVHLKYESILLATNHSAVNHCFSTLNIPIGKDLIDFGFKVA